MREPAADALKITAKQETAAESAGISQSRLSHKLKDGTLTLAQMEAFGPKYAAEYGRLLVERYAALDTPKARAIRSAREIKALAEELEQAIEHIAG